MGELDDKIKEKGLFEEYAPDIIYIDKLNEIIDEMQKDFPKVWDAMDANVTEWQDSAGDWHEGSCVHVFQEWFVKWFGT